MTHTEGFPMRHTHIAARRGGALALVGASLVLAGALAPTPALAAVTDNGGATRNDSDRTQALRDSIVNSGAKNVIILIGDGMGDSEITVARDYAEGAGGRFAGIDALPLTGSYTTYSLNQKTHLPDYVTDSAASGTGWATGTKSYDGAISVDVTGTAQNTLLQLAKANGKKTGDVSTAEIQDATPAVQVASVTSRKCYGPQTTTAKCPTNALENGGAGSISEQLLDTRPDVTLGGGAATFDESAVAGQWAGKTLWEQAGERGYQVVRSASDLDKVTTADQTRPLLGLFTPGNFPVRWQGPKAAHTDASGSIPTGTCSDNPDRLASGLSLADLTTTAIGLLDNEKGFFLQVEGASIDKQDHAANACGQIGETVDLDEAVQVALDFAKKDGNTLVVVTADHGHTSQIVDSPTPGLNVGLTTKDGSEMIVSYNTSEEGGSQRHTGTQVRIAAYGPGAANVVGLTDQTDLFFTASNALELTRNRAALSSGAKLSVDPASVEAGATTTVSATGLAGDVTATLSVDGKDQGLQADVINGTAVFTLTAPELVGTHLLAVTGKQTAAVVSGSLEVTAASTQPRPSETATPAQSANGAQPSATRNAGIAGLPVTGAPLVLVVLAAAGAMAGGMMLRSRRSH